MLVLAVGGELLFQSRELREGRIGIDRPIAIARRGAGRILAMRRPAVALVASAVAPMFAITTIALAATFAFALVLAVLAAIAAELFAPLIVVALPAMILALNALVTLLLARRGFAGGRCAFRRRTLARLVVEVLVAAMAMMRPLLTLAAGSSIRKAAGCMASASAPCSGSRPTWCHDASSCRHAECHASSSQVEGSTE